MRALGGLCVGNLFGSVFWFPFWWYTTGLERLTARLMHGLRFRMLEYGFAVWIQNFFVPMYGQYDLTGHLISVLIRFVVLIGRAVAFLVEAILSLVVLCVWILAPVVFALLFVSNLVRSVSV